MRDVAFGQYYPSKSFVHKCDPRMKILFLIVYIVAVFLSKNFYALGACGGVFLVIALFSGVPFKSLLRSERAVLFLLVFMTLLNLFLYKGDTIWWEWKFIKISKEAVYYTIFLAARLFLLVLGSSLLTLTTTPVSLADGLESLLSPLKLIFVPVHELALIISAAAGGAVIGTGCIGLAAAVLAKCLGARRVLAIGRSERKLEAAEKLGAEPINIRNGDPVEQVLSLTVFVP